MFTESNLEQISLIAEGVAELLGFILVETRLRHEGGRRSLEVTIHMPGGYVSLSDCESVSRRLEVLLDEQSPPLIEGPYNLSVQSPGIDRILKTDREFEVFRGYSVAVKARQNVEGLGHLFKGTLVGRSQGSVTLAHPRPLTPIKPRSAGKGSGREPWPEMEEVQIKADLVAQIRLYPEDIYSQDKKTASLL